MLDDDVTNYKSKVINDIIELIFIKNPKAYIYVLANRGDLYKNINIIKYYANNQYKEKILHQIISSKTLYNIDKPCLYFATKRLNDSE